jgi:hypothetical protein
MRGTLIHYTDSLRDYIAESGTDLSHDERDSSEFVDIFLKDYPISDDSDLHTKLYNKFKSVVIRNHKSDMGNIDNLSAGEKKLAEAVLLIYDELTK